MGALGGAGLRRSHPESRRTSKAEHDLIERGLSLLEKAVARLEAGQSLPEGFPQWAPRFFQQFADQCHHAKEEDVFFPVLKQRGIPEQAWAGCGRRARHSRSTPAGLPLHRSTSSRS